MMPRYHQKQRTCPRGVSKHFFEGVPVGFFEVVNEALCFGLLWNIKIQNKTYKFMISIKNVVKSVNVGNFLRHVSENKVQHIVVSRWKVDHLPQIVIPDQFCKVIMD